MNSRLRPSLDRGRPFRVGPWHIEPSTGRIQDGARSRRLEPRLVELLLLLASRTGEVLGRAEIREAVWPGTVASDESLTVAVAALRKSLGDSRSQPRFLETVPRRGYRWLVEPRADLPAPTPPAHRARLRWARLVVALAVILFAGGHSPSSIDEPVGAALTTRLGRAEEALRRGDAGAVTEALLAFQEAVALDPTSGRAWAGLAEAWAIAADSGRAKREDVAEPARRAAFRAVTLAPRDPRAYSALGSVALLLDRNPTAAGPAYQRALGLAPERAEAHQRLAWVLSAQGKIQEAVANARRAVALAPRAQGAALDLGVILTFAGRYEEALGVAHEVLERAPGQPEAWALRARALALAGRGRQSAEAFRRAAELRGARPEALARLDAAVERDDLAGLMNVWPELAGSEPSVSFAALLALVGEDRRSVATLEAAARRGDPELLWVPVHPAFDGLRERAGYRRALAVRAQS